ncbi:MAG: tRNA (N(6)-L-threonylcarbamoyladenosine(37)-C(2))-methylthiotransferase MtaB [SAR324 cluster bacterium]|nr:tRNA (N(6)-L-threonylcarbamoyladenosine(37)-C(2))-methylthiotransferase MtaB [SAR324 cluster bacterium]
MPERPRVSFHTLGCRLNQAETSTILKSFVENDYEIVPFSEPAHICVINTCTVTEHSDAKNRQIIRSIHRKNPEVCIAVIGCYSQMAAEEIKKLDGVKLVIGNAEKLNLVSYIEQAQQRNTPLIINSKIAREAFTEPVFQQDNQTTRAHLKIQDGCDFMCSFCIIPFSRGRSRSRHSQNITDEATTLIAGGAKEIVLTGVNVGTYWDDKKTLVDVVDMLDQLPDLKRIRISSIEPTTLSRSLLIRMADCHHKLVPYLHLPLQSGSNTILAEMKRQYTRESYIEEMRSAFEQVPDLCIGTDVMVGFPGETEIEFEKTLQLLDSLPFAYFHVFPFSERKGTPAAKLNQKVHSKEKKERSTMLRELSQEKRSSFYQDFIGKIRPVLFETPKMAGESVGYTDNYIKVCLPEPLGAELTNQMLPVRLLEYQKDVMAGQLV